MIARSLLVLALAIDAGTPRPPLLPREVLFARAERLAPKLSPDGTKSTRWTMPKDAAPSSLLRDPDGTFWLTELGGFHVANFDPERPLVMSPGEIPNPRSALAALDAALRTEVERFATAALDEARARLRDVEAKLSEPTLSPTSAAIYQGELDSARLALARLTGQTAPNAPSRRLMAVADRVALLGFGDQLWDLLPQERRALHRMQHVGVPAQALLHAIDAVAAGSHAAIESLDTLARAHPGHAWLDYLVEVAQRISRAPSVRVARPSAPLLPTSHALDSAREMLDAETLGPAADAWLTLGAHHERGAHARAEGLDADLQTDLDLDEDEHPDDIAAAAAEREAIQRECGPFYELSPPEAAREAVAEAVWPLLVGFRSLYGLELVTEALPQARAWLAQQMDSA